jgi:tetratricopeptide (TPR) repeat protein
MSEKVFATIAEAEALCIVCEEEQAEQIVREVLEKHPKNLDLITELAIIRSRRGYDGEAEPMLRKVVSNDPLHERATSALGNLLGNSLRTSEAEKLLRQYLVQRPDGHGILDDLCRLLYDDERQKESLELARRQVSQYPAEIRAYDALRYVLLRQEDDFSVDLADNPEDYKRLLRLAENFVEQSSVLCELNSLTLSEANPASNVMFDISNEMKRIYGEMHDIWKRAKATGFKLPPRVSEVIQDCLANSSLDDGTS